MGKLVHLALLLVSLTLCWARSPTGNYLQRSILSSSEEERLGRLFLRKLRDSTLFIEDLEIQSYLNDLGRRLASAGGQHPSRFHFFVVQDSHINAFAGPAGYVGIHSGLWLATQREDELAAVLAHEIAHVAQKHIDQLLARQRRLTLPMLAASLAAAALASQNPQAASATFLVLEAAKAQSQINFTRRQEEEADAMGLEILAKSGFDPTGMPHFFQRLIQLQRLSPKPLPILQTHPLLTERFVKSLFQNRFRTEREDSLDYLLAKAKLAALTLPPLEAKRLLERYKSNEKELTASLYGLALLDEKQGNLEDAILKTKKLVQSYPYETRFLFLLSRLSKHNSMLEKYHDLLNLFPEHRLLKIHYAWLLIKAGNFKKAKSILISELDFAHDWPYLYQLLANASENLGEKLQREIFLAYFHYVRGYISQAIYHLKKSMKYASEQDLKAIKKLLHQWQEELKSLKI